MRSKGSLFSFLAGLGGDLQVTLKCATINSLLRIAAKRSSTVSHLETEPVPKSIHTWALRPPLKGVCFKGSFTCQHGYRQGVEAPVGRKSPPSLPIAWGVSRPCVLRSPEGQVCGPCPSTPQGLASLLVLLSGVKYSIRGPGTFDRVWRHCWLSHLGERMLLAPSGRGQGCCSTSCSAQDSPPTVNQPQRSAVLPGVEKPAVSASEFRTQPEEVLLLGYALEFERCYKKREIFCD